MVEDSDLFLEGAQNASTGYTPTIPNLINEMEFNP